MGYIVLIIVVVAIVIIAFVFGTNGKNGKKKVSLPRSIRDLIGAGKDDTEMIRSIEKHKNSILAVIKEETNRQNQLSGTVTHLGEDIKGVTRNTISKKLDLSYRLTELCLNELEKENKIRRMKLSGTTIHYVLVV
jgi:hypothetical protein